MVVERIVVGGAAIIARARCSLGFGAPADADTPALRYRPGCSGSATSLSASRCGRPAGPDTTDRLGRARTPPSSSLDLVAGAVVTSTDPQMRRPGVAVMVTSCGRQRFPRTASPGRATVGRRRAISREADRFHRPRSRSRPGSSRRSSSLIAATCAFTVLIDTYRSWAISELVRPRATAKGPPPHGAQGLERCRGG